MFNNLIDLNDSINNLSKNLINYKKKHPKDKKGIKLLFDILKEQEEFYKKEFQGMKDYENKLFRRN